MRFAKLIPMVALALLVSTGAAQAQTTTDTSVTTDTTVTPGTPNTGAGGAAAENLLILTSTGALALLGATYLLRSRTR